MTLAEAQLVECNRCGDCCGSERVGLTVAGRYAWRWGRVLGGEDGLILPIEDAPAGRINAFRCSAFQGNADAGECTAYERRPLRCSSFPVFGAHAVDIAREVASNGEYRLPLTDTLFRCAWAGVVIVP